MYRFHLANKLDFRSKQSKWPINRRKNCSIVKSLKVYHHGNFFSVVLLIIYLL